MIPREVEYYVIRCDEPVNVWDGDDSEFWGDNLYWSNDLGWVTLDDADTFSIQDTKELDLPIGGTWVLIKGLA